MIARRRQGIGARCCEECGCQLAEFEHELCDTCAEEEAGDGPDGDFEYDQSFPG